MTFSARGQEVGWKLDFGVKIWPSEMRGKICESSNLRNDASRANGINNSNIPRPTTFHLKRARRRE